MPDCSGEAGVTRVCRAAEPEQCEFDSPTRGFDSRTGEFDPPLAGARSFGRGGPTPLPSTGWGPPRGGCPTDRAGSVAPAWPGGGFSPSGPTWRRPCSGSRRRHQLGWSLALVEREFDPQLAGGLGSDPRAGPAFATFERLPVARFDRNLRRATVGPFQGGFQRENRRSGPGLVGSADATGEHVGSAGRLGTTDTPGRKGTQVGRPRTMDVPAR